MLYHMFVRLSMYNEMMAKLLRDVAYRIQVEWLKWRNMSWVVLLVKIPIKLKGKFASYCWTTILYECLALKGLLGCKNIKILWWMYDHIGYGMVIYKEIMLWVLTERRWGWVYWSKYLSSSKGSFVILLTNYILSV